ncbi:MAG: aspartate-semialdehyde dehydrogenase [Anaerolineae bacterium CG_4_9_14_3_um_filter_57_17]|nr:aspartate-semialdehyde dehydrogenase [bacterium]NCT22105.1 aspartate-semialdehyde dehydrogenase [bacterium]OIO83822.1 MAG: aspartate-semialdehyde dehydrogenase [Anaerolineae bacterium CG2_30_57_67]PJB68748.1 MAG: aspartate-semialdehyde dehydrogenase [Anaerolineae bacterium CG_4_9_14_3_um_filter_57_17]
MSKIPVAILGATGSVGQRFLSLLENHPWFEVVALAASDRSVGQKYASACRWILAEPMPEFAREMVLTAAAPEVFEAKIVFSALPTEQAREIEPQFASAGVAVCSNAAAFRREADVPLLLPEVNPDHIALVRHQREKRGWRGCILTNPNCTSTGLTVALKALQDAFGLKKAFVVSLQALSGAGYPGVSSLDMIDNVIPNIGGEEEKVEWEPRKMLGALGADGVELADLRLSAHTNRVAVIDGHIVCVSVELARQATPAEAAQAFAAYQAPLAARNLPSAPRPVMVVREESDRPQPRLDRLTGKGMTTLVGRIRPDPLLHLKFVTLSHNTIRGAAGGSIFNAELLVQAGLL